MSCATGGGGGRRGGRKNQNRRGNARYSNAGGGRGGQNKNKNQPGKKDSSDTPSTQTSSQSLNPPTAPRTAPRTVPPTVPRTVPPTVPPTAPRTAPPPPLLRTPPRRNERGRRAVSLSPHATDEPMEADLPPLVPVTPPFPGFKCESSFNVETLPPGSIRPIFHTYDDAGRQHLTTGADDIVPQDIIVANVLKPSDEKAMEITPIEEEEEEDEDLPPTEEGAMALPPTEEGAMALPPTEEGAMDLPPIEEGAMALPLMEEGAMDLPPTEEGAMSLPLMEEEAVTLSPISAAMTSITNALGQVYKLDFERSPFTRAFFSPTSQESGSPEKKLRTGAHGSYAAQYKFQISDHSYHIGPNIVGQVPPSGRLLELHTYVHETYTQLLADQLNSQALTKFVDFEDEEGTDETSRLYSYMQLEEAAIDRPFVHRRSHSLDLARRDGSPDRIGKKRKSSGSLSPGDRERVKQWLSTISLPTGDSKDCAKDSSAQTTTERPVATGRRRRSSGSQHASTSHLPPKYSSPSHARRYASETGGSPGTQDSEQDSRPTAAGPMKTKYYRPRIHTTSASSNASSRSGSSARQPSSNSPRGSRCSRGSMDRVRLERAESRESSRLLESSREHTMAREACATAKSPKESIAHDSKLQQPYSPQRCRLLARRSTDPEETHEPETLPSTLSIAMSNLSLTSDPAESTAPYTDARSVSAGISRADLAASLANVFQDMNVKDSDNQSCTTTPEKGNQPEQPEDESD